MRASLRLGWMRAVVAPAAVVVLGLTTACGSRVPDARIRMAANVAGTEVLSTAPDQGSGGTVPAPDGAAALGQIPAGGLLGGQTAAPGPAGPPGQTGAGGNGAAAASGATGGAATSGGPGTGSQAPASGSPGAGSPQPAARGPATKSTVVVGVIATLSGPVGTITADAVKGIQVWAQYVNAHGGVNGHPVKVVVGDDGGDPARFNSLAQQMVESNHAIAFIFTTLGLAPGGNNAYLDAKRVVTFGTEGGLDEAYRNPLVPTAIPTGTAFAQATALAFAKAAIPAGRSKLAVLACSDFSVCDNFDRELTSTATQQITGFQVVYRARPSITQPDYTSQCLAAQQAGATAMIVALDTASVERLADGCARQDYRPMYGLPDMLALPSLSQNPNVDGAVITTRIAPFIDKGVPGIKAIYDGYAQFAPGSVPSGAAATGWTYGMLFAAAAAHLPDNPTAQDVYDGLNQIKDNDLGGLTYPLTFRAGQPSPRKVCWNLILVKNKAYTPFSGSAQECR